MKIIDMHADTILALMYKGASLNKNEAHIDLDKLKEADALVQTFAIFTLPQMCEREEVKATTQHELVIECYQRFIDEVNKNKNTIEIVNNFDDIERIKSEDKIGALISLEGAGSFEGKIERLHEYYQKGMRMMSFTWNDVNTLGFPNVPKENMNKGLTDFGKECLKVMNELGIIIDVSHLSDAGFWDVANLSTQPFIASHSNVRNIGPHVRNLTDEMIVALAKAKGVMGMNFCPAFITEDLETEKMYISGIIEHIKYIKDLVGIDYVGLGTDFDGIGGELEIANIGEISKLWDAMKEEGFTDEEIEKVAYKNVLRVFKAVLK